LAAPYFGGATHKAPRLQSETLYFGVDVLCGARSEHDPQNNEIQ